MPYTATSLKAPLRESVSVITWLKYSQMEAHKILQGRAGLRERLLGGRKIRLGLDFLALRARRRVSGLIDKQ